MSEYLLDIEATLLKDETRLLQDCVKEKLEITFTEKTPYPGTLFGGIFECYNIEDSISRWTDVIVRTILRMESRPTIVRLSLHKAEGDGKYLVRLAIPK